LTKIFLNLFDYHLAYHTNALNYLIRHKISSSIVQIIYNTINEKKIKIIDKQKAREILQNIFPEIKNKKIILYVGAILKEKKLDLLIDSLILLNKSDLILFIVGSGEYFEELKNKYNYLKYIYFIGRVVEGVEVYFDSADIFVLPGTGGLAINEAMYHSLPIISGYADGSADDLVIHNYNGFRLQLNTVEELKNYINILISDENLLIKMSLNSKSLYNGKFQFSSFINNIIIGLLKSTNLS